MCGFFSLLFDTDFLQLLKAIMQLWNSCQPFLQLIRSLSYASRWHIEDRNGMEGGIALEGQRRWWQGTNKRKTGVSHVPTQHLACDPIALKKHRGGELIFVELRRVRVIWQKTLLCSSGTRPPSVAMKSLLNNKSEGRQILKLEYCISTDISCTSSQRSLPFRLKFVLMIWSDEKWQV